MRAPQLEAVVLAAVDALRAGHAVEDDRIEFKREWPRPEKGRQLAGAANRASGDDLIYVIGIDEVTGAIHPTGEVDPAAWWASIEASFDEVAPELIRHLSVVISDTERVVALLFRTDRVPYVVRVANGGATEREVPIRDGTRTRSARRHELLRMLYPTMQTPQLTLLEGTLHVGPPPYSGADANEVCQLRFKARAYFEVPLSSSAFLPAHMASARLKSTLLDAETQLLFKRERSEDSPPSSVQVRWDGLEVVGPGMVNLEAYWVRARHELAAIVELDQWSLTLDIGVAGTDRRVTAAVVLGNLEQEIRVTDPEKRARWALASGPS